MTPVPLRQAFRGPAWHRLALLVCLGWVLALGCSRPAESPATSKAAKPRPPKLLSSYALFEGNPVEQKPAAGVIPYDLNSPLFTDYMLKYRFVKLPEGTAAKYQEEEAFEFPVGTVIAKTFACPVDIRDPSLGQRLLETRILKHEPEGWVGLPYVWNAEQTEAVLKVAGGTTDVSWVHVDGSQKENNYLIPNANQCKGCHKTDNKSLLPIGPKARHLNRDFAYAEGSANQLAHWTEIGALDGAPSPGDAPRAPVWNDPSSGSLDDRARAWLDINCAHCHNPRGPARGSGLDLTYSQRNPYDYGLFRSPVAAGAGSGGHRFDIMPGKPDDSILVYRVGSTHPGIMMPELGKRLVHEEGLALLREWIAAMPTTEPPPLPERSRPL